MNDTYLGSALVKKLMLQFLVPCIPIIRAGGSPGYSMFSTLIGAVINLALDPIFIFALNMRVQGAAIATITGQIASSIASILYFRQPKLFKLSGKCFSLRLNVVGRMHIRLMWQFIYNALGRTNRRYRFIYCYCNLSWNRK